MFSLGTGYGTNSSTWCKLASQVVGFELVDGYKLVEGSRLVEGFNDGSNDGNELVEGSIDDDGTWLVEGSMMATMTAPSLLMAPSLSKTPMMAPSLHLGNLMEHMNQDRNYRGCRCICCPQTSDEKADQFCLNF